MGHQSLNKVRRISTQDVKGQNSQKLGGHPCMGWFQNWGVGAQERKASTHESTLLWGVRT